MKMKVQELRTGYVVFNLCKLTKIGGEISLTNPAERTRPQAKRAGRRSFSSRSLAVSAPPLGRSVDDTGLMWTRRSDDPSSTLPQLDVPRCFRSEPKATSRQPRSPH